jgi:hypothetical protein
MTTKKERAAGQNAADCPMTEHHYSTGYVPLKENNYDAPPKPPKPPNERPALASWEYECILAHRQTNGQTEFLTKPRPTWLKLDDIPPEALAEYWHKYQPNARSETASTPRIEPQMLKTPDGGEETLLSRTYQSEISAGLVPAYASIAEIMNRSRTHSPVYVYPLPSTGSELY